MSSQTLEITQLRRRAEEVKRGRRRNLERVRERWERERERDRTVLRARIVGAAMAGGEVGVGMGVGFVTPKVVEEIGCSGEGGDLLAAAAVPLPPTPTPPVSPPSAHEAGGIRMVKRKKRVRQAEMQ